MGDVLDAQGSPYNKKLEIDDIFYNPYTYDVARVLSWNNIMVRVNIYTACSHIGPELNCNLLSATEQPRLDIWEMTDFVIYSKVYRDNQLIYYQVSPFSRKNYHPFQLESYLKKNRPGIEGQR